MSGFDATSSITRLVLFALLVLAVLAGSVAIGRAVEPVGLSKAEPESDHDDDATWGHEGGWGHTGE